MNADDHNNRDTHGMTERDEGSPDRNALLRARLRGEAHLQTIPPRPPGPAPLSFGQERLWFLYQLEPNSPAYNRPLALRLQGALDKTALERSLTVILQRHEALRMRVTTGAVPALESVDTGVSVPLIDLSHLPAEEREEEARRLAGEESRRVFNLQTAPLVRATLFRLQRDDHVLLLVFHHLAFDAWSARVFQEEWRRLYEAFAAGEEDPLPALKRQYADFAHWQREQISAERIAKGVDFWMRHLGQSSLLLSLPFDHPRPAVQTFEGARQTITLPEGLFAALKQLSRDEDATLYMTLFAAFHVLLGRYTRQESVVLGVPVAGRSHPQAESLIGMFINTLVFRADLSGNPSVRKFIQRTRRMVLEGLSYQDVPFEKVVERLNPERDLSRPPVYQVMFDLETYPLPEGKTGGVALSPFDFDPGISQYDFNLDLSVRGDSLDCTLVYNTTLFEDETAGRILQHYQHLLEGFAAQPDARLSELELLSPAEKDRLQALSVGPALDTHRWPCVHRWFESQVKERPDAPAVHSGGEVWTYRQLNACANRIARTLLAHGLPQEGFVGVMLERSARTIASLLGVMKAGGAYVPLSPAYPTARLRTILEDTGMAFLIAEGATREAVSAFGGALLDLDADHEAIQRQPDDDLTHEVVPDQLAYMIYTSGSTGRPKGTLVEHGNLVNIMASFLEEPGLSPEDRFLSVSPAIFDVSAIDFYLPLLTGAQIVMVDRESTRDGFRLREALQAARATVMFATPTTWRMLLSAGWEGDGTLKMLCGGEAMDRPLAEALLARGGELWNMYGPTETTIISTIHNVEHGQGPVPIGCPVANTRIYIVNDRLELVPQGVPGEILIAGAGIARGYHRRPEQSAALFLPDPFSGQPQARLYRSGDLGRHRTDGEIEFLGRLDQQVKVRGYRIEPGEIEFHLSTCPGVKAAVVTMHEENAGDRRLVAFVMMEEGEQLSPLHLRTHLRKNLPEYMLPSSYVPVEALPLTITGKIDRGSLPAFTLDQAAVEEEAPRDAVEAGLAHIWMDVLGLNSVGVHADFFDLGGHSLLATRVVARIRDTFQVEVPVRQLFSGGGTIAGLAEFITSLQWLAEGSHSMHEETGREEGEL